MRFPRRMELTVALLCFEPASKMRSSWLDKWLEQLKCAQPHEIRRGDGFGGKRRLSVLKIWNAVVRRGASANWTGQERTQKALAYGIGRAVEGKVRSKTAFAF